MDIENEIFKKFIPDYKKIKEYGFIKNNSDYLFEKSFKNNEFKAVIKISNSGKVSGIVYEIENNEEFLPLRIESNQGAFVGKIREEYENILKDVRKNCFNKKSFIFSQSNRISDFILEKYGNKPEFLWDKFPGYGVFKNQDNDKWYGAIMNIDRSKLDETQKGEIEVLNLKLDKNEIQKLLKEKSFYPAWHMNKKSWITIILDETISDKTILELIEKSHRFTEKK